VVVVVVVVVIDLMAISCFDPQTCGDKTIITIIITIIIIIITIQQQYP